MQRFNDVTPPFSHVKEQPIARPWTGRIDRNTIRNYFKEFHATLVYDWVSGYVIPHIVGTVAAMTESDLGVVSERASYNTLG
jgi:hypothetical protein